MVNQYISLKERVLSLQTLISFSIASGILVFLATSFDIDWSETRETLRNSNFILYMVAFCSYYFGFVLRGLRWRIMIKNACKKTDSHVSIPSVMACSKYIYLGWFANTITWFRLGDAYRAYILTEDTGHSFSRSIGTIVSERVLDIVTIFIVLLLAFGFFYGSGTHANMFLFLSLASVMLLAGMAGLFLMKKFGRRLSAYLPSRFRKSYDLFQDGALGSLDQMPLLIIISLLIWFTEVLRLFFVVFCVGLSIYPSISLIFFVTLANAILTTVPITPGGLGIVEPGIVGLLMLSLSRSEAVSIAILDRSISYMSIVILGSVVFLIRQFTIRNKRING